MSFVKAPPFKYLKLRVYCRPKTQTLYCPPKLASKGGVSSPVICPPPPALCHPLKRACPSWLSSLGLGKKRERYILHLPSSLVAAGEGREGGRETSSAVSELIGERGLGFRLGYIISKRLPCGNFNFQWCNAAGFFCLIEWQVLVEERV